MVKRIARYLGAEKPVDVGSVGEDQRQQRRRSPHQHGKSVVGRSSFLGRHREWNDVGPQTDRKAEEAGCEEADREEIGLEMQAPLRTAPKQEAQSRRQDRQRGKANEGWPVDT